MPAAANRKRPNRGSSGVTAGLASLVVQLATVVYFLRRWCIGRRRDGTAASDVHRRQALLCSNRSKPRRDYKVSKARHLGPGSRNVQQKQLQQQQQQQQQQQEPSMQHAAQDTQHPSLSVRDDSNSGAASLPADVDQAQLLRMLLQLTSGKGSTPGQGPLPDSQQQGVRGRYLPGQGHSSGEPMLQHGQYRSETGMGSVPENEVSDGSSYGKDDGEWEEEGEDAREGGYYIDADRDADNDGGHFYEDDYDMDFGMDDEFMDAMGAELGRQLGEDMGYYLDDDMGEDEFGFGGPDGFGPTIGGNGGDGGGGRGGREGALTNEQMDALLGAMLLPGTAGTTPYGELPPHPYPADDKDLDAFGEEDEEEESEYETDDGYDVDEGDQHA